MLCKCANAYVAVVIIYHVYADTNPTLSFETSDMF